MIYARLHVIPIDALTTEMRKGFIENKSLFVIVSAGEGKTCKDPAVVNIMEKSLGLEIGGYEYHLVTTLEAYYKLNTPSSGPGLWYDCLTAQNHRLLLRSKKWDDTLSEELEDIATMVDVHSMGSSRVYWLDGQQDLILDELFGTEIVEEVGRQLNLSARDTRTQLNVDAHRRRHKIQHNFKFDTEAMMAEIRKLYPIVDETLVFHEKLYSKKVPD